MQLNSKLMIRGLIAGSIIALSGTAAQAASFTQFDIVDITTNPATPGADPDENIFLETIEIDAGTFLGGELGLVNSANIITNDNLVLGPASSDRGDEADGVKNERPSNADIVASLGNLNLNNIVDSEESGTSVVDVFFSQAFTSFAFFERGMNSDLKVIGLDAAGNAITDLFEIVRTTWDPADYSIDTTEVPGAQMVGFAGLRVSEDLPGGVRGLRLIGMPDDNGPDYKVFGLEAQTPPPVPEPGMVASLGLVGSFLVGSRLRKKSAKA